MKRGAGRSMSRSRAAARSLVRGLSIEEIARRLRRENGEVRDKVVEIGRACERTFSWFGRNRRLAKDFENLAETLAAFVTLASIQLALRRLARA
jgi:transposase